MVTIYTGSPMSLKTQGVTTFFAARPRVGASPILEGPLVHTFVHNSH